MTLGWCFEFYNRSQRFSLRRAMDDLRLDDTDRRLLDVLAQDARITNRNLASRLGLSESACSVRLKRLEAAGHIIGYAAILSPTLTGHAVRAWVEMKLSQHNVAARGAFEALLRDSPSVIAAYQTVQSGAYLVKVGAPDMMGVERFIDQLAGAGIEVEPAQRWLVLRRIKSLAPAARE